MNANAESLIKKFGETVVLARKVPGAYVLGNWVEGSETLFPIIASIQPMLGNDLMNLTELQRTKETLKLFTTVLLQTTDTSLGSAPDQIIFRGKRYEVQSVEPWFHSFAFTKAILARIGG